MGNLCKIKLLWFTKSLVQIVLYYTTQGSRNIQSAAFSGPTNTSATLTLPRDILYSMQGPFHWSVRHMRCNWIRLRTESFGNDWSHSDKGKFKLFTQPIQLVLAAGSQSQSMLYKFPCFFALNGPHSLTVRNLFINYTQAIFPTTGIHQGFLTGICSKVRTKYTHLGAL